MKLAAAQLEAAWLAAINFRVRTYDRAALSDASYRLGHDSVVETVGGDVDTGMWAVFGLNVVVRWVDADGEDAEGPFDLDMKVGGRFVWPASISPDEQFCRLWLEYNGMYLLWPYVRSYISSVTGLSGLPSLMIYTLRVPDPPALGDLEGTRMVEGDSTSALPPAPSDK